MRASIAFLALAAGFASAQNTQQNYTSSLDMTIDPGTVSAGTRSDWCTAQSNTCDQLCDDSISANRCDIETLDWECNCSSNSSAPGLQFYTGTMPTFICKELFSQCIVQYASDADGQEGCETNIDSHCGRLDPADADVGGDDSDDDEDSDDSGDETAATTPAPSETGTDEETVSTTESDDLAAPTPGPKGAAVIAALGMVAYLV